MNCCSDVMEPIAASACCTPNDTADRAAQAMRSSGCGCAPVVEDKEHLKLVGVVTERDVCCGVAADDRQASDVRVNEIMRPPSTCCGADEPVEGARKALHEHRATACRSWTAPEGAAVPSAATVWGKRRAPTIDEAPSCPRQTRPHHVPWLPRHAGARLDVWAKPPTTIQRTSVQTASVAAIGRQCQNRKARVPLDSMNAAA